MDHVAVRHVWAVVAHGLGEPPDGARIAHAAPHGEADERDAERAQLRLESLGVAHGDKRDLVAAPLQLCGQQEHLDLGSTVHQRRRDELDP